MIKNIWFHLKNLYIKKFHLLIEICYKNIKIYQIIILNGLLQYIFRIRKLNFFGDSGLDKKLLEMLQFKML